MTSFFVSTIKPHQIDLLTAICLCHALCLGTISQVGSFYFLRAKMILNTSYIEGAIDNEETNLSPPLGVSALR